MTPERAGTPRFLPFLVASSSNDEKRASEINARHNTTRHEEADDGDDEKALAKNCTAWLSLDASVTQRALALTLTLASSLFNEDDDNDDDTG